ncbi:MAG: endonuclease III [Lactobacillaceae bacterium]|jgi:endonuclease-3|nr:endonuclease III [Lactobacillaceae bacterium]
MRKKSEVLEIFDILKKAIPHPITELSYVNPYTFLVAVILSAQSTDKGVNKATPALFKAADTPRKMVDLGMDNLKNYIKTIGLYNNKAKNIILMSQDLVNKYNGEVPGTREDLESLAGVGRKTANVFLNVIYDQPVIAVDTHVIRIANRLGFTESQNPVQIERDLEAILPEKYRKLANHLLVLFGRYTCKAQKPECETCPISKLCHSSDKRI